MKSAAFWLTVADIIGYRTGEKNRLLRNEADLFTQIMQRQIADICPVQRDPAAGYIVETGNQVDQRGFSDLPVLPMIAVV